jgi:RNA polymerase sigma-70 factor, ECF subfamily
MVAGALLIAIATSSDKEAFAQLFTHFAPRLKAHFRARGVADQQAEEITQEVMLRVWRRAGQFDPRRGSASTWIFSVARNCYIDLVRKERVFEADADEPVVVDPGAPTDERIADGERMAALQAALARLPSEQGQVLQDAYVGGQSFPEIAERQGLPLGTVKTRARLAIERLRALLTTATRE